MNLEKKRTNKERSILDEAFFMTAKKENVVYASMAIQRVIMSLLACGLFSGFGKN